VAGVARVLQENTEVLARVYPERICRAVAEHVSFQVVDSTRRPASPTENDITFWRGQPTPSTANQLVDHALLQHLVHTAVGALQSAKLWAAKLDEEPWQLGALRAQNWWLHFFWTFMYDEASSLREEARWGHDALVIALGLAQYQTTWQWPASEKWRAMIQGSPPSHWLGKCAYHLCWMVSVAGQARRPHEQSFRAALQEGSRDWPELVSELGRYCVAAPA
jgi:hypothetical protein